MDWTNTGTLIATVICAMTPIIGGFYAMLRSQWKTESMVRSMSSNMKRLKSTVISHDRDIAYIKGKLGLPNEKEKKPHIQLPTET